MEGTEREREITSKAPVPRKIVFGVQFLLVHCFCRAINAAANQQNPPQKVQAQFLVQMTRIASQRRLLLQICVLLWLPVGTLDPPT